MGAKKVVNGRQVETHELVTHELETFLLGVSILTAFRPCLTLLRPCSRYFSLVPPPLCFGQSVAYNAPSIREYTHTHTHTHTHTAQHTAHSTHTHTHTHTQATQGLGTKGVHTKHTVEGIHTKHTVHTLNTGRTH